MRILVHTIFYHPELTGVAKYTSELCEALVAKGHEVTVIAPPPYYPYWRVQPPYKWWRYHYDSWNGVEIVRCPIFVRSSPRGMGRLLYAASFLLSSAVPLLLKALRRPDAILVVEPSLLNAFGSLIAARVVGAKTWLHIQDLEIDLAYDLGQLRRGRALVEASEQWLLRRFDQVSTISRSMADRIVRKGYRKPLVLPNWFDDSENVPDVPTRHPDTVVMFSGTLGAKQGIEQVIGAARLLQEERILFVINGAGPDETRLRAMADSLSNVRFSPLHPAADLMRALASADIHILPQHPAAAPSVLPSKLIGMLASGRPIVACASPTSEIASLVAGCGRVVAPGNCTALAAAVLELSRNREERLASGVAARVRAFEGFRKSEIVKMWEDLLLSLTSFNTPAAPQPSPRSVVGKSIHRLETKSSRDKETVSSSKTSR